MKETDEISVIRQNTQQDHQQTTQRFQIRRKKRAQSKKEQQTVLRQKNAELIQQERVDFVPQLDLNSSPLMRRRKCQNHTLSLDFTYLPNDSSKSSLTSTSKYSTQSISFTKRSRYVVEIDNQYLQKFKKIEDNNTKQKGQEDKIFKSYNFYKMIISEQFIFIILVAGVLFYKSFSNYLEY